eukprot:m51a1_g9709 hypothetical protein (370) ;mRNA; r:1400545-1401764
MQGDESTVLLVDDHDECTYEPLCTARLPERLRAAPACIASWLRAPASQWAARLASACPCLVAASWLVVCLYWNCVLQVVAEHKTVQWLLDASLGSEERLGVLPDVGFELIPRIAPDALADYCVAGLIVATLVRFGLTQLRFVLLRRYMTVLGALFLIRSFTIVLTSLPNPQVPRCSLALCAMLRAALTRTPVQDTCVPTATGNPLVEGFLILGGVHKTCSDVFFSGHTVNITLAALLWHQYSHIVPLCSFSLCEAACPGRCPVSRHGFVQRCTPAKFLVWCVCAAGIVLIVGTRLHYTIDVVTGVLLSTLVFKLYHHYLLTAPLRDNPYNRFLRWYERDAPDMQRAWAWQQQQQQQQSPQPPCRPSAIN